MTTWSRITGAFTIAGASVAGVGIALSAYAAPGLPADLAAPAPEPPPATVTVTAEQEAPGDHPPEEVSDLAPQDSGAVMDESMFVSTYDTASATSVELVQRPDEFLPPRMTGGPAEVLALDIGWAHWDAEKAIGNCTVRVTGGGGEPTLYEGVRLTLDQPQQRGGVQQYTRYRFDWPGGEPSDVGQLDFDE